MRGHVICLVWRCLSCRGAHGSAGGARPRPARTCFPPKRRFIDRGSDQLAWSPAREGRIQAGFRPTPVNCGRSRARVYRNYGLFWAKLGPGIDKAWADIHLSGPIAAKLGPAATTLGRFCPFGPSVERRWSIPTNFSKLWSGRGRLLSNLGWFRPKLGRFLPTSVTSAWNPPCFARTRLARPEFYRFRPNMAWKCPNLGRFRPMRDRIRQTSANWPTVLLRMLCRLGAATCAGLMPRPRQTLGG